MIYAVDITRVLCSGKYDRLDVWFGRVKVGVSQLRNKQTGLTFESQSRSTTNNQHKGIPCLSRLLVSLIYRSCQQIITTIHTQLETC